GRPPYCRAGAGKSLSVTRARSWLMIRLVLRRGSTHRTIGDHFRRPLAIGNLRYIPEWEGEGGERITSADSVVFPGTADLPVRAPAGRGPRPDRADRDAGHGRIL